ncbi:ABC transporter permease [Proteiniborus sp.]|uniref:ABC transporter permease n=1 Tax=Proteiniborus sp. TaxID=2079015 RepID=UPI00331950FB
MNDFILGILLQSLMFSIMVMGVYITYKFLDFPDLSVDGTFTLGASISAILITKGINPFLALFFSVLGGSLAGTMTGILNVKLKIKELLSGILVMLGLYSINLRITMGKANLPMFNNTTIFSDSSLTANLLIALVFSVICAILFTVFFKTKLGYLLKATGNNEEMVVSLGINTGNIRILGLALSNALVALSGGIFAQYQGYSDINMGTGIIVIGLASIIMAHSIFKNIRLISPSFLCIIGAFLYRASISLSLKIGFNPSDLKLISCIIVILALYLGGKESSFKLKSLQLLKEKRQAGDLRA